MERLAECVIVPAGPGDAAALAQVHVQSWRETYRDLLPAQYLERMSEAAHAKRWRRQLSHSRANEVVLAAEGPGGLTAYCAGAILAIGDGEAEIFTLYLLRAVQGAGLGRRLFEMAARVLEAHGARALTVWVLKGNLHANGFYTHLGGVPVEERPVNGWGGGLLETAYRWGDVGRLTRA
jgi:ribosomal protein S18 acetylase RimI-like enzyme